MLCCQAANRCEQNWNITALKVELWFFAEINDSHVGKDGLKTCLFVFMSANISILCCAFNILILLLVYFNCRAIHASSGVVLIRAYNKNDSFSWQDNSSFHVPCMYLSVKHRLWGLWEITVLWLGWCFQTERILSRKKYV